VGHYTERLLRALMEVDRENEYLVLFNDDRLWWTWEIPDNFRAQTVAGDYESHPKGDLWEKYVLPVLIERERAALFHGPAFLIPTRPLWCRRVVTIHDLTCWRCAKDYPWRFRHYLRWVIRRSCRAASGIIAVSQATANDLFEVLGVPESKVRVIHEAADGVFQPAKSIDRSRLAQIHPALESPYILTVGTLEPRKRLDFLLTAFEFVHARDSVPHNLVVVGKVGWKSGGLLRAMAKSPAADAIHHLDYVRIEDLVEVYQGADLFVYASHYEGFGLPPLEAMACGVPVVVTAGGSLAEIVGNGGVVLLGAGARTLADAIAAVLTDANLRATLAERALERAAAFSWQTAAEQTMQYYRDVLRGYSD
jgi:glycosyltransferase involved in cell wall biosynthesis